MKAFAKFLMIGAVAVAAIAVSAAPSEAAKRQKVKAMTGCGDGGLCSNNCGASGCAVNFCGYDKQWHLAILTPFCLKGQCPPKCS